MSGYWQRPEATAAATSGGWLHTGDLVSVDPAGRVRILDRRTDLINRGGENVYSIEVERVLSRHPGVAEVAVVGVPDPMMGSKVGVVVVPRAGETVEPLDLVRIAREELADFKVPQYVLFRTEALPRNPGGKVDKAALRARPDGGRRCGDERTEPAVGAAARAGGPLGRAAGPGAGRGDRRGAAGRARRA
jgi:acyl-CoA synthetase (AMP-forming)/AMP-acid ligase II